MELKEIEEFKGYYIDNDGNAWSKKRGGLYKMSKRQRSNGYIQYCITDKGKHHYPYAHVLVGKAFIPNTENKPEVGHLDCDTTNNKVENLYWCTREENMNNPITKERNSKAHTNRKDISKPVIQYTLDGDIVAKYQSLREAERQTGIKHESISACCRGKQKTAGGYKWAYLD